MRPRRRARLVLAALLLVALAGWQGWQCHTSPALPFTTTGGHHASAAHDGFASLPAEVGAQLGAAFGGSGHEEPAAMLACLSFLAALAVALFALARPWRMRELAAQFSEAVSVGCIGVRAPRLAQLGVMRT